MSVTSARSLPQYNVIQNGAGSGISNGVNGNRVGVNPLLDSAGLQDHGGPTPTIALRHDSPAINAGNNALAVDSEGAPLEFDQRGAGFPRKVHGKVDVGAFEVQNVPPVLAANTGITLDEGDTQRLGSAGLRVTDIDTPPEMLTYTIRTNVIHGSLKLAGVTLGVDGRFTQADIGVGAQLHSRRRRRRFG